MKKRRGWKRFCIVMVCLIVFGSIPGYALNGGDAEGAKIGYSPEQATQAKYEGGKNINDLKGKPIEDIDADLLYCITDADGLVLFSNLVNRKDTKRFQMMKVYLADNINMDGRTDFVAIGMESFKGHFDGCGYKIDNLVMDAEDSNSSKTHYISLFGVIEPDAIIENLIVGEGCKFSYKGNSINSHTASLVSNFYEGSTIRNILSFANVCGGYYSGGLIAKVNNLNREKDRTRLSTILFCSNAGNVSGASYVGGIVGQCKGNLTIQSSKNSGEICTSDAQGVAGGIVGTVEKATVYPDTYIEEDRYLSVRLELRNTSNFGNIKSDYLSGSIIGNLINPEVDGQVLLNIELNTCKNEGAIHMADQQKPGQKWIGRMDSNQSVKIENCTDRSDEVRLHGSQVRSVGKDNRTFDVRFIGSISSQEYQEIGFNVTIKWGDRTVKKTFKCDVAFSSIETAGEDHVIYTAESLRGSDSAYLYAATVSDIPMDAGTVEFYIAPYGIRIGKTEAEVGEECTVIYRNGEFVPAWERAAA